MSAPEDTKVFLPCGCAGNCTVLAVTRWKWDGDDEWWFEVFTRANEHASWSWRLKTAWRVLRGHDHYLDSLSFSSDEIEPLRRFIDAHMPISFPSSSTAWTATGAPERKDNA